VFCLGQCDPHPTQPKFHENVRKLVFRSSAVRVCVSVCERACTGARMRVYTCASVYVQACARVCVDHTPRNLSRHFGRRKRSTKLANSCTFLYKIRSQNITDEDEIPNNLKGTSKM
jgi:hypothetical protein